MRPLSRRFTRRLSYLALAAWVLTMAALVQKAYLQASPANLATDLARYGTEAQWRGVYYRGEKIGFTVGQVVALDDGFELQEDGRLQMSLLGATTPAILKTTARVDREFALQSFEFSLDPGTGPLTVSGRLDGLTLTLQIHSGAGTRTEVRELERAAGADDEPGPPPGRRRAHRRCHPSIHGLRPGHAGQRPGGGPIGRREVVVTGGRPTPAFRVELSYAGISTTSWVTDTGEVIREESPLGLLSVREPQEQATQLAVSSRVQADMLAAAAVVPTMRARIDEPRDVVRLRLQMDGVDTTSLALDGAGQSWSPNVLELVDARRLRPGPADPARAEYLRPEPFVESDDPEILAEAEAPRRRRHLAARAGRAAGARRERPARQGPDHQRAVGARGAAHQGRRLQRAHRALRGDGPRARHPDPHQRRPGLGARRLLLPRLARGLPGGGRRPRPVAAGRSDLQPVSGRRHPRAPAARRPRQAGRHPAADRAGQAGGARSGAVARRGRAHRDAAPGAGRPAAAEPGDIPAVAPAVAPAAASSSGCWFAYCRGVR